MSMAPTAFPRPYPRLAPLMMASLRNFPVSSAIPNLPSPICAATSSEVCPTMANSASCMMPAPFMASPPIMPRSNKSSITGFSPTLMAWAPMAKIIMFPDRAAWTILLTTFLKSFPASILGRESIQRLMFAPDLHAFPKSSILTLLNLSFKE